MSHQYRASTSTNNTHCLAMRWRVCWTLPNIKLWAHDIIYFLFAQMWVVWLTLCFVWLLQEGKSQDKVIEELINEGCVMATEIMAFANLDMFKSDSLKSMVLFWFESFDIIFAFLCCCCHDPTLHFLINATSIHSQLTSNFRYVHHHHHRMLSTNHNTTRLWAGPLITGFGECHHLLRAWLN